METERNINVSGYEAFKDTVKTFRDKNKQLNIYFTGQKNEDKKSWCPDCNDAEPHVMEAVKKYAYPNATFMTVEVGDRAFWKDMKNPFRKDENIHLSVIPTLLRWQTPARLDGEQCTKMDLLEMFFTEDED